MPIPYQMTLLIHDKSYSHGFSDAFITYAISHVFPHQVLRNLISAVVVLLACFSWMLQLSDPYRRTGKNTDLNNLRFTYFPITNQDYVYLKGKQCCSSLCGWAPSGLPFRFCLLLFPGSSTRQQLLASPHWRLLQVAIRPFQYALLYFGWVYFQSSSLRSLVPFIHGCLKGFRIIRNYNNVVFIKKTLWVVRKEEETCCYLGSAFTNLPDLIHNIIK